LIVLGFSCKQAGLPQLWATGTAFSAVSAYPLNLRLFCTATRHLWRLFTALVSSTAATLRSGCATELQVTNWSDDFSGASNYSGWFRLQRVLW